MSSLVDSEKSDESGYSGLIRLVASVCGVLCLCVEVGLDARGQAGGAQPSRETAVFVGLGGLVMVVPFTNLSQQQGDEWLGWGIAEAVTADLVEAGVAVVQQAALGDALSLDATRRTVKLDGTLADLFDLQDQVGATVLGRPVPRAAEAGRAEVLVPPDATSASQSGGEVGGVLERRGGAHADSSTERESVRMRAGFAAAAVIAPHP